MKEAYWLGLEVHYFFYWILSSSLFLAICYLFKFRSSWKKIAEEYNLYDVFKMKKAIDHLHYYSFECRIFCLFTTPAFANILQTNSYFNKNCQNDES